VVLSCNPAESPQEAPPVVLDTLVVSIPPSSFHDDSRRSREFGIPITLALTIRQAALAQGIPLDLAYALLSAESDFTSDAESWAGALGISQVMPETGMLHCGLTPAELLDPWLNLNCGFSYLASMYVKFGDWRLALMAYHRGPTRLSYELRYNYSHGESEGYSEGIMFEFETN